jgi:hypothetical protein
MKKLSVVVFVLAFCRPASAQAFGFGGFSIVSDPVSHVKLVAELEQARQQFAFMQAQVQQMAGMLNKYRSAFAQLSNLQVRDLYGNVGGLAASANSGYGTPSAYQQATVPLVFRKLSGLPGEVLRRVQARYADAELADGANVGDWTLVGQVRANAQQNQGQLANLTSDSLSSDATTLQVAQKQAASAALEVSQLNTLQQVAAAQLEQQIIAAQQRRNEQAESLATAEAQQHMVDSLPAAEGGLTNGLYIPR